MARRNDRDRPAGFDEGERTLAAAEEEAGGEGGDLRCVCGSEEFLLEAFLHVVAGEVDPEPVEVDRLTCPSCNREFEAVTTGDGRVLRGPFLGYAELDD